MNTLRISLMLAVALLLGGCSGSNGKKSADSAAGESRSDEINYAEIDRDAAKDIRAANSAEARAWLKVPKNEIFKGSKADVVALVDEFYKAGCPKVHITGIEELAGAKVSASIVVTLPSTPSQRTAAFGIEKAFAEKHGEGPFADKGQKYIMVAFD